MTIWDHEPTLNDIVRRFIGGEAPSEIAVRFGLTPHQVLSKMRRLGHFRHAASDPARALDIHRAPKPAGEPRMVYGTRKPRLLEALANGPRTVEQVIAETALTRVSVAQGMADLVKRRLVVRLNPGAKRAVYALRAEGMPEPAPAFRGDAAVAAEAAYIEARKAGRSAKEAAADLRLSATTAHTFETALRYQTVSGYTRDSSCPKFAHDDRHLDGVWRAKGFPALSERRRSAEHVSVCFPITWPSLGQGVAG